MLLTRSAPLIVLVATVAFAAPVKGKVVSVEGRVVVVQIQGPLQPWMKKGTRVKLNQRLHGKVVAVAEGRVSLALPKGVELAEGATVTLASPEAPKLKKGEKVTFDDALDHGGC
jgi:molybdopterin-binding protein